MSINPSNLTLVAIEYISATREMLYQFSVDNKTSSFSATANDHGTIRGVAITEPFDEFLRPFLATNPTIVKQLVRLTWAFIDGEKVSLPKELI